MTTAESNFIENRKLNIKNSITSVKCAFFVVSLLTGLVFPWFNSSLWEKLFLGILLWIDLWIVLLYATRERMNNQRRLSGFFGWQTYFINWLLLYCSYRIVFEIFHWLLIVFIGYGIIQSGLWVLGVVYNIRKNVYIDGYTWQSCFNLFTVMTIFIEIAVLSLSCSIVYLSHGVIACIIVGGLLFLHYFFLIGMTFLVQWYIMKKIKLIAMIKLLSARNTAVSWS